MPELPKVQTVVDTLHEQNVSGRPVTGAAVYWPKAIADMQPADFCKKIMGCTILQIDRRGKYLVFDLSSDLTMLIHLRMTRRLNWVPRDQARNKHEHVIIEVGNAHTLRFQDTPKFGRIWLTDAPERILDRLGPEPLEDSFTVEFFSTMLQTTNRQIKPLLLDQHFLAVTFNATPAPFRRKDPVPG